MRASIIQLDPNGSTLLICNENKYIMKFGCKSEREPKTPPIPTGHITSLIRRFDKENLRRRPCKIRLWHFQNWHIVLTFFYYTIIVSLNKTMIFYKFLLYLYHMMLIRIKLFILIWKKCNSNIESAIRKGNRTVNKQSKRNMP